MLRTEKINNTIVVKFNKIDRFNALISEPVKEDLKSFFNKLSPVDIYNIVS